jgi:hypothetical protein
MPPLLKKFSFTLANPLKSLKELNFGFQSLFDQLDADFLFLIKTSWGFIIFRSFYDLKPRFGNLSSEEVNFFHRKALRFC